MKTLKRLFPILFVAILSMALLSSCSNSDEPEGMSDTSITGTWQQVNSFNVEGYGKTTTYLNFDAQGVFTKVEVNVNGKYEVFSGIYQRNGNCVKLQYTDSMEWKTMGISKLTTTTLVMDGLEYSKVSDTMITQYTNPKTE